MADADGKYAIGDIVPSDGKKHLINIHAYASGEKDDYLSYIIAYRNGKVFKIWDVRNKKIRKFREALPIIEKDKAWYIVKVYGKRAWKNTASLDVMRVCEKNKDDEIEYREGGNDVAFTNPFYFWRREDKDPETLESKIDLTLNAPPGKPQINDASIDILVAGKTINTIKLSDGKAKFSMPVNALLKVMVNGYPPLYRNLYLDYPPHQKLVEDLASGNWMNKYDSTKKFNSGEVPWQEFNFEKTKQILSDVKWNIELAPNERDSLWKDLDAVFKP